MPQDLTREQLLPAMRAWCYYAGYGDSLRDILPSALKWLAHRWDDGDEHLPLTLVLDLGALLLRGREFPFASARHMAHWPENERAIRLSYEDRVLGRWALDPTVTELHIAIAGMAERYRDDAVAHAIGLALGEPLRDAPGVVLGNPAHLRSREKDILAAMPEDFSQWEEVLDETWRAWARGQLDTFASLMPSGRLVRPEHIWEVAHLPELPSDSARLALREIHAVAAAVGPVSSAVALGVKRRAREVPVDAEESDHYPAGGFDAVSTKGTFENLVRTEIAYVGEGKEEAGIDLFDVRFAEGELLYYTRDESPLLDARRDVTLVLDRPSEQRFKQASLPEQTLVLAQGLVLALQGDLVRVFGPAGSKVRVVWRAEGVEDTAAAEEERTLLQSTLAAEVAHRRVELMLVREWGSVPEPGRIVFSPRAPDADVACVAWVRTGDERWKASVGAATTEYDLREEMAYPAMRALGDELLLAVARGQLRAGGKKKGRGKRAK